jgi:hypothetical protein
MTPREKAKEMYHKFMLGAWGKENAIHCVNEILSNARMKYSGSDAPIENEMFIDSEYWLAVKKELKSF